MLLAPNGGVDVVVVDVLAQVHRRVRLGHPDHALQVPHRDGHAVADRRFPPELRIHLRRRLASPRGKAAELYLIT